MLFLVGLPILLGLTRPGQGAGGETPGVALVYAHGLSSLGIAGLAAICLAIVFAIWLIAGQLQEVNRKYLGHNARRRHSTVATLRTLAIILGVAGLIIGSLSGLYAGMLQARPELYTRLPLPFFTAHLALICLIGGGGLYAAGRVGR
ncbi:MAG: hypothetical protein Q8R82_22315 [Hyphomonadaceae bacterium]|nr:hypothetical protein [Hyphomonadaceae bacterium]